MKGQILFLFGNQACVPDDGLLAARQLGYETSVFGPKLACCMSADLVDRFERIDLSQPERVVEAAQRMHASQPFDAVVAYDDQGGPLAARVAAALGLRGHPVESADAARDKAWMKQRFEAAGLPIARYTLAKDEDDAVRWAEEAGYPVVVKPVRGSASQGVIRADDEEDLREAYRRLRRIVQSYRLDCGGRSDSAQLVESYIEGDEYSVELLVRDGVPHVLCVFEKPQPLEGPFFEETIYVSPARLDPETRERLESLAVRGVQALGLRDGAAHCEIRGSGEEMYILEIGGRLIGGACSRVFRHVLGEDIHPHVLRLALGKEEELPKQKPGAAGAMMLPIPKSGRLKALRGLDRAGKVPGIEDVILNTSPGEIIVPFPEQSCYVGFLTASGESVEQVERALSEAASLIDLDLEPLCCETWTRSIEDQRAFQASEEHGIRSLEGCTIERAEELILPLVAATNFGECPEAVGVAKSRECFEWFREGHRGETSPEAWFVSEGRGCALGSRRGETCYVSLLGVLPDERGTGLGGALMRSIMALYARQGCTRMEIAVEPTDPGSTALFRTLGFAPESCDVGECCTAC
ncbi:MAG TPA: GNAT family N-acetyltransferase [Thermoanaerobaculia bacterium]|jgi:biotin carboxylase/GNAT superfamily N-acetyltransferase|nr:GNAT family N-acetyltransferase [Thermoanaerobaculia bacterium]